MPVEAPHRLGTLIFKPARALMAKALAALMLAAPAAAQTGVDANPPRLFGHLVSLGCLCLKLGITKRSAPMPLAAAQPVPVPSPPGAAAQDIVLAVPFVSQKPFANLCWAACGAMIFQYYHVPNATLCSIASGILGVNCCANPPQAGCDTTDQRTWPQNVYNAYGFTCQYPGRALTQQEVQAWIANMQPVQPYFQWRDNEGNHTVLIVGYYANGDLLVYDPLYGVGRQSYQFVLTAYNRGSWQDTWYDIRLSDVPLA